MVLIFLSLLLFALNNVLWKQNLQQISTPILIGSRAMITSIISIIVLISTTDFEIPTSFTFLRVTLGSIFGAIGLFCMLKVIKYAPLQWLGIYTLLGIVLTTLYLLFFEEISILKSITGSSIIAFGFTIYLYQNQQTSKKLNKKNHLLLIIMTISYNSSSLLHWKNLAGSVAPIFIIANQEIIVFIVSFLIILKTKDKYYAFYIFKIHFKKIILMAIVIFFALLFVFIGLKETNPFISNILFLSSPLLTILFGALFFKERLTILDTISIVLISLGALILHYQQNFITKDIF